MWIILQRFSRFCLVVLLKLTLRLCTRGGDNQEPRNREALWEDWA